MTALRRLLVVQLLVLWQGGFLFYAAFVVPAGTELLGAAGQGAITARVTDSLNVVGAVGVAMLALELACSRDPNRRRTAYRWCAWVVALLCQSLLFYLHAVLDGMMDAGRLHVVARESFYPTHRLYLWASTLLWLACLLWTWWTIRAWRAEDESGANHRGTETQRKTGED